MTLIGGGSAPEFEPFNKNTGIDGKNEKVGKCKVKSNEKTKAAKKYSNHIEFAGYIPTYKVITYRHLFVYGVYVE